MDRLARWSGQAMAYALFVLIVGYFSASPSYTYVAPDKAMIRVSFSHAGQPVRPCRRLSPDELAALAPNMRRPLDCPRERVPLLLELELDGDLLYRAELLPSGLHRDGASTAYARFIVTPGRHSIVVRLRDSRRESGFDYVGATTAELAPRQNFIVDFRGATGEFVFL